MTVRVRRSLEFDASPEEVWAFISDAAKRAGAISVVDEYEVNDESRTTWQVRLPIPLVRSTIAVETREVERDPPRYVKFVGRSRAFTVTGKHTVEAREGGTRLVNEFIVDGRLPGVETFFKRNLDDEMDNLERAMRVDLGLAAS